MHEVKDEHEHCLESVHVGGREQSAVQGQKSRLARDGTDAITLSLDSDCRRAARGSTMDDSSVVLRFVSALQQNRIMDLSARGQDRPSAPLRTGIVLEIDKRRGMGKDA